MKIFWKSGSYFFQVRTFVENKIAFGKLGQTRIKAIELRFEFSVNLKFLFKTFIVGLLQSSSIISVSNKGVLQGFYM